MARGQWQIVRVATTLLALCSLNGRTEGLANVKFGLFLLSFSNGLEDGEADMELKE